MHEHGEGAGKKAVPRIWIDTDTGVDDALALLTAVYLEKQGLLRIMGVSAVCGNVEVEKTFENARNVLYLAGREDIKVWPGAKNPVLEELQPAYHVHGNNGLGGAVLPPSPAKREEMPAWEALYRCAEAYPGELELILIGPETNAAIALNTYPKLAGLLKRILIMGGAETGGNVTPAAEFNIWADPHGAQAVFKSGVPLVMCGLDVTMKAFLDEADLRKIDESTGTYCRFFAQASRLNRELVRQTGVEAYYAHDVCPVVYAVRPDLFTAQDAGVFVETRGRITRGKTVSDRDTDIKFGVKNTKVVYDVDRRQFAGLLMDVLTYTGSAG